MLTFSDPVELLFLRCIIAAWACVVVSVRLVFCSLSVYQSMCLFVLCVGEVNVFSFKVMVLFFGLCFFY